MTLYKRFVSKVSCITEIFNIVRTLQDWTGLTLVVIFVIFVMFLYLWCCRRSSRFWVMSRIHRHNGHDLSNVQNHQESVSMHNINSTMFIPCNTNYNYAIQHLLYHITITTPFLYCRAQTKYSQFAKFQNVFFCIFHISPSIFYLVSKNFHWK